MNTWRCGASPLAPAGEKKAVLSLWETSLQANRAGPQALPQANIRQQAGSYRGKEGRLVFVGNKPASESCRPSGITAGEKSPAGRLLQDKAVLSLWELACKRIVPDHRHHRRRKIAGRPAPTGQSRLVFVGACLQANRAGPQASPQAKNRQQAGSYRGKEGRLVFVGDKPASQSCRTGAHSFKASPGPQWHGTPSWCATLVHMAPHLRDGASTTGV
jgi:hypothetical protein